MADQGSPPDPSRRWVRLHGYSPAGNRPLPADVYAEPGNAVFFTIRSYTGRPFLAADELCDRVIRELRESREKDGCWVNAYCLMPDHIHFIAGVSKPGSSVLTFASHFKGRAAHGARELGHAGRLWQNKWYDHVLRKSESLIEIGKYILANPVRAGLVESAEDWPWSGIMDEQR